MIDLSKSEGVLVRLDRNGEAVRVHGYPDSEHVARARRIIDEQYQAARARIQERCILWAIGTYAPAIPID